MLKNAGWQVNAKRVERIWRREGLKVPMKNLNGVVFGSMMDHV